MNNVAVFVKKGQKDIDANEPLGAGLLELLGFSCVAFLCGKPFQRSSKRYISILYYL